MANEVVIDGFKYVREDKLMITKELAVKFLLERDTTEFLDIIDKVIDKQIDKVDYIDLDSMVQRNGDREQVNARKLFLIHTSSNIN